MTLTAAVDRAGLPQERVRDSLTPLVITLLLASFVAGIGSVLGFRAIDPVWAAESLGEGKGALGELGFLEILVRNTSAALLLYSGVITLGLSTLGVLTMTSVYVGATMSVGVTNSGLGGLIGDTGAYLPFELIGMLAAAAAGLFPLVRALLPRRGPNQGIGSCYLGSLAASLRLLAVALGLVLVGAVIEAALLSTR